MAKLGQAGPPHPRRVPGGSQGTQRPSGPPCHPPQGQGLGGATPTHPPPSAASLICYCIKSANGGRRWFREKSKSGPQHFAALAALGGGWGRGERGAEWGDPRIHPVPAGSAAGWLPHPPPEALPQFPHPPVTQPWSCCRAGRKGWVSGAPPMEPLGRRPSSGSARAQQGQQSQAAPRPQ